MKPKVLHYGAWDVVFYTRGGKMPEEFSIEKLREEVNPIYNTAAQANLFQNVFFDKDQEKARR